jgi:hypothetical protein
MNTYLKNILVSLIVLITASYGLNLLLDAIKPNIPKVEVLEILQIEKPPHPFSNSIYTIRVKYQNSIFTTKSVENGITKGAFINAYKPINNKFFSYFVVVFIFVLIKLRKND